MILEIANAIGSTFAIRTTNSQSKNCKRATKPTHKDDNGQTNNDREKRANA